MDCGHGSLVKLGGLREMKFNDPHTSADPTRRLLSCWPRTSSSAWTGRMLSGQSTNQTTWAASDVTVVTDTDLKLVFRCYLCVLDRTAASCRRQAVSSGLFRWHQKTVLEIIIAVLHCFERKACWPICFCDVVQLLLWIRSVPVSNAMDCETCVRSPYCPISCHCMTEKRQ